MQAVTTAGRRRDGAFETGWPLSDNVGMHAGTVHTCDVTVIGGGLAGMAASLHLAKAGLRVVCIEPETQVRQPVGESLDWASPGLLGALGLPMDDLIRRGFATYERGVTLQLSGGRSEDYRPGPWLARPPFNVELRTIHVDRMRLDRELQDLVLRQGVTVVHDKAISVEKTGMRIASIHAASGGRFASPWFIDASGSFTSLFAREFRLPAIEYGPTSQPRWRTKGQLSIWTPHGGRTWIGSGKFLSVQIR
jgi:flavin-dependent dehydrogenase